MNDGPLGPLSELDKTSANCLEYNVISGDGPVAPGLPGIPDRPGSPANFHSRQLLQREVNDAGT